MQDAMEWMTILIRWGHVMAGIAWIGTSFYFNWFDLSVRRPEEKVLKENVRGTLHEVHGGSFYYHEQYWPDTDHPRMLGHAGPAQLTFLTGIALIAILYWYGASILPNRLASQGTIGGSRHNDQRGQLSDCMAAI